MKKIIAVAAAALFATGAYAQASAPAAAPAAAPASAPMAMPHAPKSHKSATSRVEMQIKSLHSQLKITSAEEDQWGKVTQAMRDNAAQIDGLIAKRKDGVANMTAVDYLNAYGEIQQAHADGVKSVSAAFEPLYSSMPDSQKKLADSVFRQGPRRSAAPAKAN